MIRASIVVLSLLALSLPLACKRDTDPPSEFVGKGGSLPPIRVSERVGDKSIIGSVSPAEESSRGGPGSGREGPSADLGGGPDRGNITIDDSTPEGVMRAFVEMVETGRLVEIPNLLVPEQQVVARDVYAVFQPLADAQAELRRALDQNVPGHGIGIGQGGFTGKNIVRRITVREIQHDADSEEALATIEEEDGSTGELPLKRVDGRWRIFTPELPASEAYEKERSEFASEYAAMTLATKTVTVLVEAGEIKDRDDYQEAWKKAIADAQATLGSGQ